MTIRRGIKFLSLIISCLDFLLFSRRRSERRSVPPSETLIRPSKVVWENLKYEWNDPAYRGGNSRSTK